LQYFEFSRDATPHLEHMMELHLGHDDEVLLLTPVPQFEQIIELQLSQKVRTLEVIAPHIVHNRLPGYQ
jgi:hypothetical protein